MFIIFSLWEIFANWSEILPILSKIMSPDGLLACMFCPPTFTTHSPTIFTLSPFELLISSYNKYYRHAYVEQDNLNYLGNIRSRVCSKVQTFSLATYLGPCLTSSVEFKGCVLHEILDFGILLCIKYKGCIK